MGYTSKVDVAWVWWHLKSLQHNNLFNSLFRLTAKKTLKLCIPGPLWGESTGDWWIPLRKGQQCRKHIPMSWCHHNHIFHPQVSNDYWPLSIYWNREQVVRRVISASWRTCLNPQTSSLCSRSVYMNIVLTHWPLGDLDAILKTQFSILFYWLVSSHCLVIMPWDECHGTSPMISQHWFR